MRDKNISFFITIEDILYSNISFSSKIEKVLPYIENYFKAEFVAFVSKSLKKGTYNIFSTYGNSKKGKADFVLLLNEANITNEDLQQKELFALPQDVEDELFLYILPLGRKGVKFNPSFLYICFNKYPKEKIESLIFLHKILQNFYKYNEKIAHLKNEYAKIKLLYEISKTIDRLDEINMKTSLFKVMSLIKKYIYFNYFSLYIKEENGSLKRINLESSYEIDLLKDFKFNLGIGLSAWVADANGPVIVNDLAEKKRFKIKNLTKNSSIIDKDINSIVSMPLFFKGRIIGVLNLARISPYKFYKKDLKMLEIVSSQIASILENLRLLNRLENMAYTDGLTGLFNYRYFIREFEKEIKRAERYNYKISIIMIDIDDFKRINDTFGHDVGNLVLKRLSDFLSSELRSIDVLARYGGEEFIILLPNTGKDGAEILAERLRKKMEEKFNNKESGLPVSVTITLGISSFPEDGDNIYDLIKKADIALYKGKKEGKNVVIVYRQGINEE